MKKNILESLGTESVNKNTNNIDQMNTLEIVRTMNDEDYKVPMAVKEEIQEISKAVDTIVKSFRKNGRLFYIGAGTSGRLGVLDASECPPTFNTDPNMVIGLIAGGDYALRNAMEGVEDSQDEGASDLKKYELSSNDVVVGIAASGRTPYVLGGLKYARNIGASTISVACNKGAKISSEADISIEVNVGPEVLTGSTRLKSGTAQKMVLNILTTASMIKIGKTYKNYMVDLQAKNEKLRIRSMNIVNELTGLTSEESEKILIEAGWRVKTALIMALKNCSVDEANNLLEKNDGRISTILNS
ncbi:MAG: N-acetylmuramic acid 6-phosphate etherase [Firmicutes bacterium]|jgi:N-acetylmuramic acid 6-phosphate etherase|nr:N-acetylmuramic acid 6-phosphate etherase [Bacillota bacterium]